MTFESTPSAQIKLPVQAFCSLLTQFIGPLAACKLRLQRYKLTARFCLQNRSPTELGILLARFSFNKDSLSQAQVCCHFFTLHACPLQTR